MDIKPGGTEGGDGQFMAAIGFILAAVGLYFLFDSVHVRSGGQGWVSGMMRGRGGGAGGAHGGGMGMTTSMGIIFVPFIIATIALFYDATKRWAWYLLGVGIAIIIIELLSRLRFQFDMKTSHLLLIFVLFSAGIGLMIRSFKINKEEKRNRQKVNTNSPRAANRQDTGS